MDKKIRCRSKAIQQIEFDGQLTNVDGINAAGTQNMFLLTNLEKIKKTKLKFSQEVRVTLTNTQLNKLKSAAKNKAGTILRSIKKKFDYEELPHELFLTTRQT